MRQIWIIPASGPMLLLGVKEYPLLAD